ncbi:MULTISPECIES: PhoH family protein [unclassified Granulicatella]|uniref:PhoH family protein n=1 Tax=unclassified Granulicatella TaxID=2630493 RepID=UPI00107380C6|nr:MULTISPECIES: PhoH family protein [unclassified Granulicatella]MBF0780926.1 PhoH family protein [Granulicatella sp. 19428wC4_WM01]TFU93204.1 phosphate starvation-inducible protein PhoH [Granulicatella sp. WM01]
MNLEQVRQRIELSDANQQIALFGVHHQHIEYIEKECHVMISSRGEHLDIIGQEDAVNQVKLLLEQLIWLIQKGETVSLSDVVTGLKLMANNRLEMFKALYSDEVGKTHRGETIHAKTYGQRQYIRAIKRHDVVFGIGPAGTGKTFLAVVMAVNALRQGDVKRIVLTRPAVEAGENLGFLPGDLKEKVDPYLRPVYDALHAVLGQDHTSRLLDRGIIEIAPLAYMRGRTLDDAFVILDEAQNTTIAQMKMFLTRLGFRSKMIVNGDVSQIDLGKGIKSGLLDAQAKLKSLEDIRFVTFDEYDVVRHALVAKIIQAYAQ